MNWLAELFSIGGGGCGSATGEPTPYETYISHSGRINWTCFSWMRQCTIRERLRLIYIDFISCSESVLIYFLALTAEQVNWQRYGTKRETNIFPLRDWQRSGRAVSGQSRSQGLRQPNDITALHPSQAEVSLILRSSSPWRLTKCDSSEDDLKTHARSTRLTEGWEAKSSSGVTFKPSMDVADLFQAGVDWDRKHERTLKADEGLRVVLKE